MYSIWSQVRRYNFVWDTVVCISSLIEHVPYTSLAINSPLQVVNREHRTALKSYNRAIQNVKELANHGQLDDAVIVLSYVLFSAAEFHQKNVETGNVLLQRCSKVLIGSLATIGGGRNPTGDQAIHQVITPFVMRRAFHIATFEEAIRPRWAVNDEINTILRTVYPTLNEFRIRFHELASQCYEVTRLVDVVLNLQAESPSKTQVLLQRQSLLDKLILWKVSLIATRAQSADVESVWVCSYLLMYWAVCYISLATCLDHRQVVFDDYVINFAEIIENAAFYLGSPSRKIHLSSGADAEAIPALYFCAIKCRDPVLRREALRLIRQLQLGNLWGIVAPDRVVEKFISVEENGYVGLPPEERRFACANVFGMRAPGGRQRKALELSRFEYASNGSRRLITRYTWLDDEEEGSISKALV
ncbi:hypothetical protein H2200_002077 [Cladophialophora chaetospira]|uniref:C6 zinc finger domain protein n=1 Tax=Cladophialophora chaetospira TaxID=386627 RepID=A0AA39CLT5_9EURO|nr:hypothetical protein H2200_002077 [Cladophialophora chaetospira]